MYISIMRYRTGKFGVTATELTKNAKRINSETEISNMKAEFGRNCSEYRIDNREGIAHVWVFDNMSVLTDALLMVPFPKIKDDE